MNVVAVLFSVMANFIPLTYRFHNIPIYVLDDVLLKFITTFHSPIIDRFESTVYSHDDSVYHPALTSIFLFPAPIAAHTVV